jgi:hypothetical protein
MENGSSGVNRNELQAVAMSLGRVINSSALYGAGHSVTRQSVDSAFEALKALDHEQSETEFDVTEQGLALNGIELNAGNPLVQTLAAHLSALDVHGFSLPAGMSKADFEKFIEVILTKPGEMPAGGFAEQLNARGVTGVRASRSRYQKVEDDEVVVGKSELRPGDGGGGEGDGEEARRIESFLKGRAESSEAVDALEKLMDDPGAMTGLVMDAARSSDRDLNAEKPLGERAAESLQRAFDGLSQSDALRTKKGRKKLKQTLLAVEDGIREQLGGAADSEENGVEELSQTTAQIVDELEIDTLATDYMKKRRAIADNEKRILRFIRAKGREIDDTELRDRLEAGGLTEGEWRELLARSGIGGEGSGTAGGGGDYTGPGEAAFGAIGQLAVLLTDLQKVLESAGDSSESAQAVVSRVNETVQEMVQATAKKIENLVDDAAADAAEEEAARKSGRPAPSARLSKKKLLVMLGEIGQELCQPLAVIDCSLQMLLSRNLGDLSRAQTDTLELASGNTERLRLLADKMITISGTPDTLAPDREVIGELYGKPEKQE